MTPVPPPAAAPGRGTPTGAALDLPLVLVTARMPDDVLDRLRTLARVVVLPGEPHLDVTSTRPYRDAEALITHGRQPVDEGLLDALPRLRVTANMAVGHSNIDLAATTRRSVVACNTPGVLDAAVAELAIGMVIALLRRVRQGDRYVRSGQWQQGPAALSTDVHGKVLGILGLGRIGRRIARIAGALDMGVRYTNRRPDLAAEASGLASYCDRERLFRESDVVLVTLPLDDGTRGSVGSAELRLMKPTAYLVNIGRGPVVDEAALVDALRRGIIAGAALDVMEDEPLSPTSPLCGMDDVLLSPHAGSATVETRRAMAELAVDNVVAVLDGRAAPSALRV